MAESENKFFENLVSGNGHGKKSRTREEMEEKSQIIKSNGFGDAEGKLTIDVYQTPAEIVVESAIAGVKPEDLDINVSNDSITIKGERYREEKISDENYFYQECYWGRFSRSVILPEEVDPDGAKVSFKNGILTVKMPKASRRKTKKLKVE